MLLAIDTSAGSSAAIYLEEQLISFENIMDPFGHAENIANVIASALQKASVDPKQLRSIAIGRGPASYTGLRVGMAFGLSMAEVLGISPMGVMTLDAVALAQEREDDFVVAADAKRRQLFARAYRGLSNDGLPYAISEPEVFEPSELAARFAGMEVIQQSCTAVEIGRFASRAISAGISLSDVSALYLRNPDVAPSSGKRVTG